jgi:hypothetical protein
LEQLQTEKLIKTTANKVLPKARLKDFYWTFVQGSTAVILLNICASISPTLAKPPNRQAVKKLTF